MYGYVSRAKKRVKPGPKGEMKQIQEDIKRAHDRMFGKSKKWSPRPMKAQGKAVAK